MDVVGVEKCRGQRCLILSDNRVIPSFQIKQSSKILSLKLLRCISTYDALLWSSFTILRVEGPAERKRRRRAKAATNKKSKKRKSEKDTGIFHFN